LQPARLARSEERAIDECPVRAAFVSDKDLLTVHPQHGMAAREAGRIQIDVAFRRATNP
jgi:hypothetical protein